MQLSWMSEEGIKSKMESIQEDAKSLSMWRELMATKFGGELLSYLSTRINRVRRLYANVPPGDLAAISRIQGGEEEIENLILKLENVDEAQKRLDNAYELCINEINARSNSFQPRDATKHIAYVEDK